MTPERSRWTRRVLALLTVLVFAAVAVQAARVLRGEEPIATPEPGAGEVGVARAIATAGSEPIVARGYVFEGPGSFPLRLCNGRDPGSVPRCVGPWLSLEGTSAAVFAFERGEDEGDAVSWQEEPIAVRGVIVGTRMQVLQVLS